MKYPTITATTAVVLASVALQVPAAAIPIPGLPFTPGFINDPTIPSMPTIQNIPAVPYTPTNMYNPAAIPGMPDLTGLGGIHTNDEDACSLKRISHRTGYWRCNYCSTTFRINHSDFDSQDLTDIILPLGILELQPPQHRGRVR
ncbi:MAG: hypothetical protein NXY57DRAFT_310827 [Lentinula lateritia]|nr:MAG: hypothetical protein NXY57DRAFT_310827 [Lentinula lateritia]